MVLDIILWCSKEEDNSKSVVNWVKITDLQFVTNDHHTPTFGHNDPFGEIDRFAEFLEIKLEISLLP